MADVAVVAQATSSVPRDYTIPGAQELLPKAVSANMDGSGAATSWYPCLQVLDPGNHVMFTAIASTSQTAGASVDVSWFPGLGGGSFSPTAGTGVPPAGNLDGYIFETSNVTITGIGHSDRTNLLIQGNTVTLDGATSIQVQYYCSLAAITNGVASQGIGIELWDHFSASDVDKGTIGLFENTQASTIGAPMFCTVSLTPAAGTHTYSVYGWKNVNSGTATLFAATFVDGTGNIASMFYRIIVIPYDPALPT